MSRPESLTQPTAALAIANRDRATALAWLEHVGSWPSSDRDVAMTTAAAERLLGFPSDAPFTGAQLDAFLSGAQEEATIRERFAIGVFKVHRQGTIRDALGARERLCVTSGYSRGEIAGYVRPEGADTWERDTPCYNPWPELDRVVADLAGIVIHASTQSREGLTREQAEADVAHLTRTQGRGSAEIVEDADAPYIVDEPYIVDAYMLGPEFAGTLGDLGRFVEILAEQCEVSEDALRLESHCGGSQRGWEPSESDWNESVDRFAEERPDLFGAHASTQNREGA